MGEATSERLLIDPDGAGRRCSLPRRARELDVRRLVEDATKAAAPGAHGAGGGLHVGPRIASVVLAAALLGAGSEGRARASSRLGEGALACSHCHDTPTRLELRYHEESKATLARTLTRRWCLDCHDAAGCDLLLVASGDRALFADAYLPCSECHFGKAAGSGLDAHATRAGGKGATHLRPHCGSCHPGQAPATRSAPELPSRTGGNAPANDRAPEQPARPEMSVYEPAAHPPAAGPAFAQATRALVAG